VRWLTRLLAGFIVILLVAVGGGWLWLRSSLPQLDGTIALAGLSAPVEVTRDRYGVPHIRAQTDRDAFFALGFVHAQDRLWQMDFQRRFTAGRLSEVVGPRGLASDRMMRTLGLYRLAEGTVQRLSPGARATVEAYAAGVNAYIARHRGAWPPEFYLLRYRPERWTPADSLVWGRMMGLFLSRNWHEEALRAVLAKRLSAAQLELLFPPYPSDAPTTLARLLGIGTPVFGEASDEWVLSGAHTASGKPLLANDPHLRLRMPGIWYLARIDTPDFSFAGATVAGVPFPILGHNRRVAWGFTSAESDVQDLFVERVDPKDPGRYLVPGGSAPFETRTERIKVRGAPDDTITIRATRHGPVISGLAGASVEGIAGPGAVVALQTPTLAPDDHTADALYHLARARNWREFRDALRQWDSPQQNIVYADVNGRIGYIAPARLPIRRSGDGSLPSPGWDGSHDWTGFVAFDDLPQAVDPARGVLFNANNPAGPPGRAEAYGGVASMGWRARRIRQLLSGSRHFTLADMTAMQMDTVSLSARALLPLLLPARPATALGQKALSLMRGWDGTMDRNRPQPLIYTAWLRALVRLIFADEVGEAYPTWARLHAAQVIAVLTRHPAWCDDVRTQARESCADRVAAALDQATAELAARHGDDPAAWRWGTAHQALFDHPVLGRLPVIGPLFDVDLPVSGGADTLNRGLSDIEDPRRPYASIHGAGYRGVYDLAALDRSRFIVAPGQSGNPFSPHYADLAGMWRAGGFLTIAPDAGPDADRLVLSPPK
jgi:penicillin amidase